MSCFMKFVRNSDNYPKSNEEFAFLVGPTNPRVDEHD